MKNLPKTKVITVAANNFLYVLAFVAFITLLILSISVKNIFAANEVELLSSSWNLNGNNGASEKYQQIDRNLLQGKDHLKITYDLHGACVLPGDASAIIIDQPQGNWHFISLANFGKNCHDGSQTIEVPLSSFSGLNLNEPVGTLHTRFWYDKQFNIDITSIVAFSKSDTPQSTNNPSPTMTPKPTVSPTATPSPTNSPTATPIPSGYSAQYFNNRNLSGTPKLTRVEQAINYTWNANSPDSTIQKDLFSARWTRVVNLSAGTYKFTLTGDDGIRLLVDGQLVINGWKDQPATTYTKDLNLSNGNHTLVIEYYENYGGAVAKFDFVKVGSSTPAPTTSPTPTATPKPTTNPTPVPTSQPTVNGSWEIQSVSSMKESKDRICSPRDAAWIGRWVDKAKELGANYVAVETPYENPSCNSSLEYTKTWVSVIRSRGLKVWHRHMPLAFEGIYSVNKTKGDYLNTISSYIRNNPGLFAEGDIFTPIPEPQNGGISGITYCAFGVCQFDNAAHFNKWLRDAIDTSNSAFSSIGLGGKMKVGYYGFDGFVAWGANNPDWNGILEDATIAKMGNLTIDHYPELIGTSMKTDLDELQQRYPNVPIIFGEWGSTSSNNLEQQVINSMGAAKRPGVVGFNYWHMGMGGNEALINDDFSNRPQFDEVQSYFKGTR